MNLTRHNTRWFVEHRGRSIALEAFLRDPAASLRFLDAWPVLRLMLQFWKLTTGFVGLGAFIGVLITPGARLWGAFIGAMLFTLVLAALIQGLHGED